METATVSSVSEAITALQAIQAQHGDLSMRNEEGGPFQFSAVIWNKEDRRKAGGDLRDGVAVDGVAVVMHCPSDISQKEDDLLLQVEKLKCYLDRYETIMMEESQKLLWNVPVPADQKEMLAEGFRGLSEEAWKFQGWLMIDIRAILEEVEKGLEGIWT